VNTRQHLTREAKLKGQTNMNSFVNQKKKVVLGQQRKAFGERPKNQNVDQNQQPGKDGKQMKGKLPAKKVLKKQVVTVIKSQEVETSENDVSMKEEESEKVVEEPENRVVDIFGTRPAGVAPADQSEDPQLAPEYASDVYQYLLNYEHILSVPKNYLQDKKFNYKLRTVLVDWLVQVNHRFQLLQETLFTTVDILDRYLAVADDVEKKNLQLVGVTAMHIASKYEEMYAPEVTDYVYVSDNSITKEQVIQMEMKMLKAIKIKLGKPHCLNFLRRNSKAGEVEPKHHFLAKYLMELALVDYHLSHVYPSRIGASALCLSLILHDGDDTWTPTLEHYSTYSKDELMPTIRRMCVLLFNATYQKDEQLKFVHSKFSHKKHMRIAKHESIVENVHLIKDIAEQYSYDDL